MTEYIPTRTVRLFADNSELLYLTAEYRYVWQRRKPDGKGVEEFPVTAENDAQAIAECGRLAFSERL